MLFSKLLIAVDGSQPAADALHVGIAFAKDQGASVVFCYALENVALIEAAEAPSIDVKRAIAEATQAGRALLEAAAKQAAAAGVSATTLLGDDEAVPFIIKSATDRAVDLIVIGTHGRRGIAHALLGSTAEGVLHRAQVPVLVVRSAHAKQTTGAVTIL